MKIVKCQWKKKIITKNGKKYVMFMDCKKVHISQNKLEPKCNPRNFPMTFFIELEKESLSLDGNTRDHEKPKQY